MFTALKRRHVLTSTVIALLLGCLAAPALGDETNYFPDDTSLVWSLNVSALLKSKTIQGIKENVKWLGSEGIFAENTGFSSDNIVRISVAFSSKSDPLPDNDMRNLERSVFGWPYVITTSKPAKVDEIKHNLHYYPTMERIGRSLPGPK